MIGIEFLIIFGVILIIYTIYQLFRNEEVFKIRVMWILTDDERWSRYSYKKMFDPNLDNWFGLRWPSDKNYK